MKKNLFLALIASMFILIGPCPSLLGFEEGNNTSGTTGSGDDAYWVHEYARRPKVVVKDIGIGLEVGVDLPETVGISIKLGTTLETIQCCKFIGDEHSWCNTAKQDKRC